jgi:DNA-binding transcriptional MerR regulator
MGHQEGLHSLGEVRALTGLSDRRIRYYEQLGLVEPARSTGGQRLYTAADVARLQKIKALLEEGLSLRRVRDELAEGPGALEADDADRGDAASHFRGVEWVHRGQVDQASPLSRHPEVLRRLERDEE